MGTVLDTARLKKELGAHLSVDSRSVHAFIIGEHGDSEIAAWSSANVSGIPLNDFCEMRGHYEHEASMKAIVGANGIEEKVPITLSEEEQEALKKSAETLKAVFDTVEI